MSVYDPSTLSPREYALAMVHAQSINLSLQVLGYNLHDPETCPTCKRYGPAFAALVESMTGLNSGEQHAG